MNKAYKIKKGLELTGREVFLADGEWRSQPFYAVLEPKWRSYKTDFESSRTEIGSVSADYYIYTGPFNHNILLLSENACLYEDGVKYIFKKREAVKFKNETLYYTAVLRRVWEESND